MPAGPSRGSSRPSGRASGSQSRGKGAPRTGGKSDGPKGAPRTGGKSDGPKGASRTGGKGAPRTGGKSDGPKGASRSGGKPRGAKPTGAGRSGRRDDRGPRKPADGSDRKEWGALARRGAGRVRDVDGVLPPKNRGPLPATSWHPENPPDHEPAEEWVLVEEIADEADAAVGRGRSRPRRSTGALESETAAIADGVRAELAGAVGAARVERYEMRLKDAGRAFRAERFGDAARIARKLAKEAPGAPSVRELFGLILYRQEKWREAVGELEAFRFLSGSVDQNPVLADCYRALGAHEQVDELWRELRAASPGAELVTEGRIVAAGDLADQGDLAGARRLLEQGFRFPGAPREHHLRRAYALADVTERAGDVVRARDLFSRIAKADPAFADARRRARSLT